MVGYGWGIININLVYVIMFVGMKCYRLEGVLY